MAVPEHTVKTAEIDLFTPEETEVFDKTVGIKSRHIAPDTMCASDMCQAAGEKLLEELGWEKDSINALIFESVTGDYRQDGIVGRLLLRRYSNGVLWLYVCYHRGW